MRLGVLVVLALCLVSTACAEDLGSPVTGEAKTAFLTTWSEHLRSMRSLHMLFRQEKNLRVLRQALVVQGELWLKGETLLYVLKNSAGETELMVHLDKQTVQTYYPLLNTSKWLIYRPRVPFHRSYLSGILSQMRLPGTMRLISSWTPLDCTPSGWCPGMPEGLCRRYVWYYMISGPKNSCRWRKMARACTCILLPSP